MGHVPTLGPLHFDGGANVTSDNDQGTSLRQLLNIIAQHLNASIAYGYQALGTLFTSDGSGDWQEITGLATTVELPFGGGIHAIATIQGESVAGGGKLIEWAVQINGDQGGSIQRYLSGVSDVGSIAVQHFLALAAGTYTVKAMMKDANGGAAKCLGQLIARGTP